MINGFTRSWWLSEIPAEGIKAAEGSILCFAVEGRGKFPKEAMRHDEATLRLPEDAGALKTKPNHRFVVLLGSSCTPELWEQAGWKVHIAGASEWAMTREEFMKPRNFFGEPL